MKILINNILHPPTTYQIGQVWWNEDISRELVITDVKNINTGILRTMLIGASQLLNDIALYYDIKVPKNEKVLPTKRVIFTLTSGPVVPKQLHIYVGKFSNKLIEKIVAAEKDFRSLKIDGDADQDYILRNEYAKIHKLHIEAINELEANLNTKEIKPSTILRLPVNNKFTVSEPIINYSADVYSFYSGSEDEKLKQEKINNDFWSTELKNKNKETTLIKSKSLTVRITQVEESIYFIVFSKEVDRVYNIIFEDTQSNIKSDSKDLILIGNRGAMPLNSLIKKGKNYNLSFSISDLNYSFPIEIK